MADRIGKISSSTGGAAAESDSPATSPPLNERPGRTKGIQSTLAITDLAIPDLLLYRTLCSREGGLSPNPPCYTGRALNSVPDEVCEIPPVCNPYFIYKWYLLYRIPMQEINPIQQTNFNHPLPPIKSYSTNSTVSTRFLPSKSTLQNPLSPPTFSHQIAY